MMYNVIFKIDFFIMCERLDYFNFVFRDCLLSNYCFSTQTKK